jgi:hypothetical protein
MWFAFAPSSHGCDSDERASVDAERDTCRPLSLGSCVRAATPTRSMRRCDRAVVNGMGAYQDRAPSDGFVSESNPIFSKSANVTFIVHLLFPCPVA